MQKTRVQKLITFSPQLYTIVKQKAQSLGVSFTQYIRMLAVSDVKEDIRQIPMVDLDTEKRIGESLEALQKGKYKDLHTEKDLEEFLTLK